MNEKDLCDILIQEAEPLGFDVYPEYAGWDLLLTYRRLIFGVQAKLDLNIKLLSQAVELGGVHFHVILYPMVSSRKQNEYAPILRELKLIQLNAVEQYYTKEWKLFFPAGFRNYGYNWLVPYLHRPKRLVEIPDFHYSTPAGVRSPRQVSQYIINVCKLEAFALKQNEYVSLAQIRAHGFRNVPKQYYEYDHNRKLWRLRPPKWRASKDYPHVASGLANVVV